MDSTVRMYSKKKTTSLAKDIHPAVQHKSDPSNGSGQPGRTPRIREDEDDDLEDNKEEDEGEH